MDKLIVIATLFAELLAMLICWYSIFKKPIKIDFYFCGIIVFEMTIMYLVWEGKLHRLFFIIQYIVLWLYFFIRFKFTIKNTLIKFIYGIAICGLLEILLLCITLPFQNYIDYMILSIIDSCLMLLIMCIFSARISKSVKILDIQNDKKLETMLLFYVIIELLLFFDLVFKDAPFRVSMMIVAAFIFVGYIYIEKSYRTKVQLEIKNAELKMSKLYGDAYSELILSVRKRQHDFKNQLGVIYSMHLTAKSLEELIESQRTYADMIIEQCKYDSILTNCNNKILAGYLYYKCIECENEGILVEYDISVKREEFSIPIHELIELLGILIDNACEEVKDSSDCKISLKIKDNIENIMVIIANPASPLKSNEIDEMFIMGKSSKGENRGIGLARLKEIAETNNTSVLVENEIRDNCNWLRFEIEFSK